MLHWLQVAWSTYVLHTEHNDGYQWWSGPGSDIGQVTLVGAAIALYRHHNCHVAGCPWPGHPVEGTSFRACRLHHPHLSRRVRTTPEDIARAAREGH